MLKVSPTTNMWKTSQTQRKTRQANNKHTVELLETWEKHVFKEQLKIIERKKIIRGNEIFF